MPLKYCRIHPISPNISKNVNPSELAVNRHKPRILVAPLDWGLGHISRCIPIIHELQDKGCEIWIASQADSHQILSLEFTGLHFLELKGYHVNYPRERRNFRWKILKQIPKILFTVRSEHRWLKKIIHKYEFEAVISDNRYGLYHHKIPCVFITHQLNIQSGFGSGIDKLLRRLNRNFIKRFSECWIPDFEGTKNLAGDLSHDAMLPENAVYIGPISRFDWRPTEKKIALTVVLSGPEPQRSMLEERLLDELKVSKEHVLFIRGLPATTEKINAAPHIMVHNYMGTAELNQAMLESDWVICRSGYSSVMDLITIRQKAILIPTPGQAEQEYLSDYLFEKEIFYSISQEEFRLEKSMAEARAFPYRFEGMQDKSYRGSIGAFLDSLPRH